MRTALVLLLLVFLSALAIVYFKHSNRQLLIELHAQHTERDALNSEWTQLLLEESTLITHTRVENIAKEELHMTLPKDSDIIWIQQEPAS